MKRLLIPAAFAVVTMFGLSSSVPGGGDKAPEGFENLFNGKDLAGWKSTGDMKVWGAENGVIYVQGGGGGWLLTEKEYGDYELRLEYKMSKGANSGVCWRWPMLRNALRTLWSSRG